MGKLFPYKQLTKSCCGSDIDANIELIIKLLVEKWLICNFIIVFQIIYLKLLLKVSLNRKLILFDIYLFDGSKIILFVKQQHRFFIFQ